jgi:hypothetical protein
MLAGLSAAAEQNASAVAGPDIHAAFDAFLNKKPMNWRATRRLAAGKDGNHG